MPLTLVEVLQKLEKHKYELAVWTLIENMLCPYLDMDEHRRAEAGLRVFGCSEDRVPVEVFERIIEAVRTENIEPITAQIEDIERLNVEESEEDEDDEKEEHRPKPTRKKIRKSRPKKATKATKPQGAKRLRSVAGRPR